MSSAFDVLFAWSETLDGGTFDESVSEFELKQGKASRTVKNQMIMVAGERHGQRVVVTWTQYLTEGFPSSNMVYRRDVLDVLVREPTIALEGVLSRRTWLGRLFASIGIGRGWRPTDHDLFADYKLEKEEVKGPTRFDLRAYSDAIAGPLGEMRPWKVEYQVGSGVNLFWESMLPDSDWLDAAVELALTMCERPGPSADS